MLVVFSSLLFDEPDESAVVSSELSLNVQPPSIGADVSYTGVILDHSHRRLENNNHKAMKIQPLEDQNSGVLKYVWWL